MDLDYIIEKGKDFPDRLCDVDSLILESCDGKGIHYNKNIESSDIDRETNEILDCYNPHYNK